mmetsp:Transcript_25188/g.95190  ORF Transcript_25188/g.95190 Transcript_25188/m.95190 type:complete len:109 (-) Transcript_25188:12-338(-)
MPCGAAGRAATAPPASRSRFRRLPAAAAEAQPGSRSPVEAACPDPAPARRVTLCEDAVARAGLTRLSSMPIPSDEHDPFGCSTPARGEYPSDPTPLPPAPPTGYDVKS